jgi:hypothetical protein
MKRGTLPKMLVTLVLAMGRASLPASRIGARTQLGRSSDRSRESLSDLALLVCLLLLAKAGH